MEPVQYVARGLYIRLINFHELDLCGDVWDWQGVNTNCKSLVTDTCHIVWKLQIGRFDIDIRLNSVHIKVYVVMHWLNNRKFICYSVD